MDKNTSKSIITSVNIPIEIYEYAKKNNIKISHLIIEGYKSLLSKSEESLRNEISKISQKLDEISKKLDDISKALNSSRN